MKGIFHTYQFCEVLCSKVRSLKYKEFFKRRDLYLSEKKVEIDLKQHPDSPSRRIAPPWSAQGTPGGGLGKTMGWGGQLGGVAFHAQRQIRGANDGDATAPPGTQYGKLDFRARWRTFSLIFVGSSEMHAPGHLPKKNVQSYFVFGKIFTFKVNVHFTRKYLFEKKGLNIFFR